MNDFTHDKENVKYMKYRMAIEKVLKKYNSPMSENAESFVNACKTHELDCFLLPAIAGTESTFGQFIALGTFNPFGWGQGYMQFKSWDEAIDTVGAGLRENYINKGAKSVEDIGYIYANKSDTWAGHVRSFMKEFQAELDKIELYFAS